MIFVLTRNKVTNALSQTNHSRNSRPYRVIHIIDLILCFPTILIDFCRQRNGSDVRTGCKELALFGICQ